MQVALYYSNSLAERLTRVPRVRRFGVQIPDRPNLTQRCKLLAIASTSTQIAAVLLSYDMAMGIANSFHILSRVF